MKNAQDRLFLFDLDGTLLDTKASIVNAYRRAIETVLGYRILPDDNHQEDLLRRRPLEYFAQHYPGKEVELANSYSSLYESSEVKAFPSLSPILRSLKDAGLIGIVTNKARARVEMDLEEIGWKADFFDVIVTAENTEARKPDPAPIIFAMTELHQVSRENTWYIGDGPHDIQAARSAGLKCAAACWGYYRREELAVLNPDLLFSSTEHLLKLADL
ncbi:HAD family hydrolase [Ruegeria atlantica]|uniref:HAD family hydrolase n=1 Tax=Ruegeria atlantica TaxID=81569 RepID=UPI001479B186|nr:HAD-IA family hydrolase [Ruegeria atlantica]